MSNADPYRVRVSAAILRPGDEILVVRESRLAVAHVNLPGGAPRLGESLDCAAVREALEETGYEIETTEIAFVAERREDRWSTPVLEICFYAEITSEERHQPMPGDGAQTLEWLPLDHPDIRHHMPHAALFATHERGQYISAASPEKVY
ncbi:MAG: NUDIX hydrolase [bacterium]|nr:NUDIX hydrolase [bacterium]